jgi:hypothetical protein
MGQGSFRLLFAVAVAVVTLGFAGSADASGSCAARVLADWRDGRIDGTYTVSCYRQALAQLPEDVRVYSSAQSDITRALQSRLRVHVTRMSQPRSDGNGASPLLVVAVTAAILAAAGSVAAVLR